MAGYRVFSPCVKRRLFVQGHLRIVLACTWSRLSVSPLIRREAARGGGVTLCITLGFRSTAINTPDRSVAESFKTNSSVGFRLKPLSNELKNKISDTLFCQITHFKCIYHIVLTPVKYSGYMFRT